jgi:hypothetical protein
MPNFTNVELTSIHIYLRCGAAGGKAVQAQILYRDYREQFLDRVVGETGYKSNILYFYLGFWLGVIILMKLI